MWAMLLILALHAPNCPAQEAAAGDIAEASSATTPPAAATTQNVPSQESRPINASPDGQDRKVVRDRDASAGVGDWLRPAGALALVVAIIFALRYVLKKLGRPLQHATGTGKALDVIARVAVAPHQQLLLVRLGQRLVLVGSGPSGLSTLSEISQADEVSALLSACGRGQAGGAMVAPATSAPAAAEGKA